jgi:DNA-binding transcriptional regulator YbjK
MPPRRRRHDPDRRERLVDAAVHVLADRGIAGLSHRAVAARADVPLGSTTYHFASRDDLLLAALRRISEQWLATVERWEAGIDPAAPLPAEITRLVQETLSGDRARARLEYELYLAALRHPALRPLAAECLDAFTDILRRRTGDDATARALVALVDGLTLQLLLTDRPATEAEIRPLVERLTGTA